MRAKLLAIGLLLGLLAPVLAWAQSQTVSPFGVRSTNASSTITSGGTFQSVFAAITVGTTQRRYGCLIQNTGTHTMYVFFGPIASATTSNSFQLSANQSISCANLSSTTLQDQVSITGTTSDTFVANQQ